MTSIIGNTDLIPRESHDYSPKLLRPILKLLVDVTVCGTAVWSISVLDPKSHPYMIIAAVYLLLYGIISLFTHEKAPVERKNWLRESRDFLSVMPIVLFNYELLSNHLTNSHELVLSFICTNIIADLMRFCSNGDHDFIAVILQLGNICCLAFMAATIKNVPAFGASLWKFTDLCWQQLNVLQLNDQRGNDFCVHDLFIAGFCVLTTFAVVIIWTNMAGYRSPIIANIVSTLKFSGAFNQSEIFILVHFVE